MDYIKRKDVIKIVRDWFSVIELNPDILVDSIMALPAADVVERKKGKWILHHDNMGNIYWTCSECGFKGDCNHTITNFCNNCGADMRKEN